MTTVYHDNYDQTKPFSDTCLQLNLVISAEQTFTIPGTNAQNYRARFTYASNSNVFVGLNVMAVAPVSGAQTNTNNLEFRPDEPKFVKGGDVLHFISPDAAGAYVGVSLLLIPG